MMRMSQPVSLVIVGLVTVAALLSQPNETTAWAQMLAIGLIAIGIAHGATDFVVARRTLGALGQRLCYLVSYILLSLLPVLVYLASPMFALALLLLLACWHFGAMYRRSGDDAHRWLGWWQLLSVGTLPIVIPALAYSDATTRLFSALVGENAAALVAVLKLTLWPVLPGVLVWVVRRAAHARESQVSARVMDVLEVLLSAAVFLLLPPLIGFAVYFSLIHAPRHWTQIDLGSGVRFGPLMLEVALLTIIALGLIGGTLHYVGLQSVAPSLLFLLLCLAVPHALNEKLVRAIARWVR